MRKKYWKTGCVIATLLCLTACGKAQTGEITPLADNMIHLYLAEDNTVVRADADYQLKTPDAIASCVEDAMTALTAMETSKIEAYSYMMGEDNSLQMDITLVEGSYEQEDILLIMAATTKTLFQMDDISSIALTVKGHDEKCMQSSCSCGILFIIMVPTNRVWQRNQLPCMHQMRRELHWNPMESKYSRSHRRPIRSISYGSWYRKSAFSGHKGEPGVGP